MTDYAELRAALDAGPTPGPWEGRTGGLDCGLDTDCAIHTWERCIAQIPDNPLNQRDMAYIAAANPKVIRALLAERDALREAAQAALIYDQAIQSCANDPNAMSSFCTAVGDDLDTLYEAWITKSRAALAQGQGGDDAP